MLRSMKSTRATTKIRPLRHIMLALSLALLMSASQTSVQAARRSRIDASAPIPAAPPAAAPVAAAATANSPELVQIPIQLPTSTKQQLNDNANAAETAPAAAAAAVEAKAASSTLPLKSDPSSDLAATVLDAKQAGIDILAIDNDNNGNNNGYNVGGGANDDDLVDDDDVAQSPQFTLKQQNLNNGIGSPSSAECDPELMGFELVTGYVFSAPDRLLDSLPGTLMLTDCLEACQSNDTCQAVNYETGLCVLFSSNSDRLPGALTKSQFPVFTIYAQKTCLGVRPCARAWSIDRVHNYKLKGHAKRSSIPVTSRRDCLELCLGETEFTCRSANYNRNLKTCELSEMDRITLAGTSAFQAQDGIDYLENNCAEEPNKLCEFKRISGRILKTVDSVYQDVSSIDECRDLCLNSPYRCHSYDFGDTGDMVCRLSHHSRATLADVQDPYLEVPEAATYELSSCYNVTIECGAGDMIARIRTSKLFDGKLYAKGSPKSCAVDVKSSLDFELRMGYQDLECNVRQNGSGRYVNDVVIQHHDMIVTSSDLGLAVTCQYDLTNKSVSNEVDLDVRGDIEPALSEEVIVDSPNVIMKITSRDGSDVMRSAEVGDPLALKFEILDEQSPYEIFVRELVAMDGTDNAEITLIDSNGCPTDHFIMGPIYKSSLTGKVLLSHFDAFKFPSSEVVQFRALVTPCMPTCEPIQCDQEDAGGEFKSLLSYGRRRRSINVTASIGGERVRRDVTHKPPQDDMLLVQSIQITDKFGFDKQQQSKSSDYDSKDTTYIATDIAGQGVCVNAIGLVIASTAFLLAQLALMAIWTYCSQQRRKQMAYPARFMGSSGRAEMGGHHRNAGYQHSS